MRDEGRTILLCLSLTAAGVALERWLALNPAEADPLAWWTWTPAPKPPGAWYDERQAALRVYAFVTPLIPTLVFGSLLIGKRVRLGRALLRAGLVLAAGLMVAGVTFAVAHQPRYLWGRSLFTGLLAFWLGWAFLRHGSATNAPSAGGAHAGHSLE